MKLMKYGCNETNELDFCGLLDSILLRLTSDTQEVNSNVVVMVTCLNGQNPKVIRKNIGIVWMIFRSKLSI